MQGYDRDSWMNESTTTRASDERVRRTTSLAIALALKRIGQHARAPSRAHPILPLLPCVAPIGRSAFGRDGALALGEGVGSLAGEIRRRSGGGGTALAEGGGGRGLFAYLSRS